ncbi:hypothetical protein CPC08DRAFT_468354 [Agrocybe pediades]|nr:hypothetical protein CPC08DRAFT_468354 [Agrocybe pediades]
MGEGRQWQGLFEIWINLPLFHPLVSQSLESQILKAAIASVFFLLLCELLLVFRGQDLRAEILRPVYSIILSLFRGVGRSILYPDGRTVMRRSEGGWAVVKERPKHVETPTCDQLAAVEE